MQEIEFEIDRDAVKQYFQVMQSFVVSIPTVWFCGLGVILGVVYYFTVGEWLCLKQVNALRYRLEGSTLRADGGLLFLFRKSIPLERITDIALVQGPILRHFNIWIMRIQTAGSTECEATLWGVREPEKIRELILAQRQSVYGGDVVCEPRSPHPNPLPVGEGT